MHGFAFFYNVMLLLLAISYYFYNKFAKLADKKGYPRKKWGWTGVAIYAGIGFFGQIVFGVIIGILSQVFLFDIWFIVEKPGEYILALLFYIIAAIIANMIYRKYQKKPDLLKFDEFGAVDEPEFENRDQ